MMVKIPHKSSASNWMTIFCVKETLLSLGVVCVCVCVWMLVWMILLIFHLISFNQLKSEYHLFLSMADFSRSLHPALVATVKKLQTGYINGTRYVVSLNTQGSVTSSVLGYTQGSVTSSVLGYTQESVTSSVVGGDKYSADSSSLERGCTSFTL